MLPPAAFAVSAETGDQFDWREAEDCDLLLIVRMKVRDVMW